VILAESSIRKLIALIIERGANVQSMAVNFGGSAESDSFESGEYDVSFSGNSKFVFPVGIYKGVSYKNRITSKPQKIRTDVGNVKDTKTGKVTKRGNTAHEGYDIGCPTGTPLIAVTDGIVVKSVFHEGGASGYYIKIKHGDGSKSLYCHMKELGLPKGTKVKKGDIIGLSGKTGKVTGPHLHFGFQPSGSKRASSNPSDYSSIIISGSEVTVKEKEKDLKKLS